MNSTSKIEALQAHIKILEDRKSYLETKVANVLSVIDKCKSWIQDTEKNDISFTDLIIICAKTSVDDEMKDGAPTFESAQNGLQQFQRMEQDKTVVDKIISRLEVIDDSISSILSSKELQENKIAEATEHFEMIFNNLIDKQNKFEKKINKYSSGMKEKINKLELGFLNHEDSFGHLSDSLNQFDLMTQEKFSVINDKISFADKMMHTHDTEINHLQHNIDEITEKYIFLEGKLVESESDLSVLKDFIESKKMDQQNEFDNLEKKCGNSLKLLMSKLQTVQRCFEQNIIQMKGNEKKIQHLGSELQLLPTTFDKEKPWMVTEQSLIPYFGAVVKWVGCDIPQSGREDPIDDQIDKIIKHTLSLLDNNQSYDKQTGIITIPCDGLYLVNFEIENCIKQPVKLAVIVRNHFINVKFRLVNILEVEAVNNKAHSCTVKYFKKGDKICLHAENNEKIFLRHFACVKLQ